MQTTIGRKPAFVVGIWRYVSHMMDIVLDDADRGSGKRNVKRSCGSSARKRGENLAR